MGRKLMGMISKEHQALLAELDACVTYLPDSGIKNYRRRDDVLNGFQTGIVYKRLVRYAYRSSGGRTKKGVFAPYGVALSRSGIYIVGSRVAPDEMKADPVKPTAPPVSWPAERFTSAEPIRGSRFVRPTRVDVLYDGAFGPVIEPNAKPKRVVIEFSPKVRARVWGRRFHPTQRMKSLPDGRLHLIMDVQNLLLVPSFVLSWGSQARVLEPPSLVAQVARELRASVERYEEPAEPAASSSESHESGGT